MSIITTIVTLTAGATTATTAIAIAIVTLAIWACCKDKNDGDGNDGPREPPVAQSRVPFVGHMINLLLHQTAYFSILRTAIPCAPTPDRSTQPQPITTLKIFSQRIYVISSPALAQAAFRASRTVDFEVVKQMASCRAVDFDRRTAEIVQAAPGSGLGEEDPEGGRGQGGGSSKNSSCYMQELHHEMYGALMGPSLLETNARLLNCLAQTLNGLGTAWEDRKLFSWLRKFYVTASAEALYGKENPIAWDEKLEPLIWDFEKDLGLLVLDFFPAVTARRGHAARVAMADPFEKYYRAGLSQHASGLVQDRERCARKWGMGTRAIAQAEITILFAAVTNTVPNVYFMLCYLFSNPELLAALRAEVGGIVRTEGGGRGEGGGRRRVVLSIGRLREQCPLLAGCFQETLRLVKTGASIRTVLADTVLAADSSSPGYLLKKGGIVQIPTGVLQSDPAIWGPDAPDFNPYRWIESAGAKREARKVQAQAYLPFGGGKNLCPGRQLAFHEMAAFAAMVVWGFEIRGGDGGLVREQRGGICNMGNGSTSPRGDLDVKIRRRKEFEGCMFGFDVGGVEAGS
ncbi:hypothetical protein LZ554_003981 [Drepanopeziza brunnea f. sp. 'monogermtubi']|nr:hypothetical protein LZ554_003981 [Drepanopeziza brunnea f. sp. 'monogermtubi']